MIDFNWTESTLGLSLFFLLSYILFVIAFYKRCVYRPLWRRKNTNTLLALFAFFLIIIVSENSGSDWYNYQHMVWNYDLTGWEGNHGERVYYYIIRFVNKNYLLFRLIVWGGAFGLTCMFFKRMDININIAIYFIIAVFLIRYNYSRSILAMASYFYGLSFMIKPLKEQNVLNILIVLLFMLGAYVFHHSLLPLLLLSLVMYFPLNKPFVLFILVVLLPIIAAIIMSYFNIIDTFEDEYLTERFNRYVTQERDGANIFGRIANVLMYGAFAIPIVLTTITIFKNRNLVDITMTRLYRVMIAITLFSLSFLFMGLMSTIFTYRYLFMTTIPIAILAVYLYTNRMMSKKKYAMIVIWGIISNIQLLLYGLYKTL